MLCSSKTSIPKVLSWPNTTWVPPFRLSGEWSCRSQMFILLFLLKSRRDEIAPVSPLSAKAALLPTTCLSSTSLQARRPPSTTPLPQWTSWWTRSSGTYSEQGTPCCSTMSCLQVESRWLTRQSGCVDGSQDFLLPLLR